jgi:endonuclease/exonuclease/phosphatase family metal-dependent hydrolase
VHHQPGRADDGVGESITSRWPITPVREARGLTLVEITAPEPRGGVLLVHHSATYESRAERERERQAVASARIVEETLGGAERHVVLAGDLNATPDAASIRFWTGRQSLDGMSVHYQDAWSALHPDDPGHTFTPDNGIRSARWRPQPGRRIDYVMVRCGDHGSTLDIASCELAFDRSVDGIWASDHFGVVADLEPAPPSVDP